MIVAGACGVMALTSAVAAFLPAARADSRSSGVAAWRRELAAQTAGSAHGPWRLSRSRAMSLALPAAYFESLGLARLSEPARA